MFAAATEGYAGRSEWSIEERVAAQRAIEQVYWNQRIWPPDNPGPKPALAEVLPDAELHAKVADALAKSRALGTYWSRPLTAVQLQAELDRMVAASRAPHVLQEIFRALGEDPALIVETLVRSSLVDRVIRSAYAHDERFHGQMARRARTAVAGWESPEDMKAPDVDYREVTYRRAGARAGAGKGPGESVELEPSEWDARLAWLESVFGAAKGTLPVGRMSSVQESEDGFGVVAILAAGDDDVTVATVTWPKEPFEAWWARARSSVSVELSPVEGNYSLPTVAAGDCSVDTWTIGSPASPVPSRRGLHSGVWTGSELIVWGGLNYDLATHAPYFLDTGGRFDPATNVWTAIPRPEGILAPRAQHTAVWTGTEMIVWGGAATHAFADGARFDPASNTWQALATAFAPSPRAQHTAVWTGTKMIVWGGDGGGYLDTGARYDPVADAWTPMTTGAGEPAARVSHTAVWTGSHMIVWGGWTSGSVTLDTGGVYDPASDSWNPTAGGAPSARFGHTAVWTGSQMIVWGGEPAPGNPGLSSGGRYDPVANAWTPTSTVGAPAGRRDHTAVWTGTRMIVWGGWISSGGLSTGGRYDPASDTWQPTSVTGAPSARSNAAAVWTGTRMIVWGGRNGTFAQDTGGSYDPNANAWVPTPTAVGDRGRFRHSTVWTGAEMMVWGGYNSSTGNFVDWGSRYDPATDTWLVTASSPSEITFGQELPAVWTGTQMIVWGANTLLFPRTARPGLYSPATNAWTLGAESGFADRSGHTAVWTGTGMIVWGGAGVGASSKAGSRYDPVANAWSRTAEPSFLVGRIHHVAVWTGSRMLVWGGAGAPAEVAIYDPGTDTWTLTPANGTTPARDATAVWTGEQMIVWGGVGSNGQSFNTGGRFYPATAVWTNTSTGSGVPSPRSEHSAVWTGTWMIVWGGGTLQPGTNTGGRYDPLTDGWSAMSTEYGPPSHARHSGVWTGSRMIVWGGTAGQTEHTEPWLYCDDGCLDVEPDGVCEPTDNCPGVANPEQENADGDALGDACDCNPADPNQAVPGPVSGVAISRDAPFEVTLSWTPVYGATTYDVLRGDIGSLPVGPGVGEDCFPALSDPVLVDATVSATAKFYLVRAHNGCGDGSFGSASDGTPRITNACP